MNKLYAVLMAGLLAGCGAVDTKIAQIGEKADKDLVRTSEMAEAYGKPAVKQCSDFLLEQLRSEDLSGEKLKTLLAEPTEGLASAGLKAALIAEYVRGLDDPAKRATFEKAFQAKCNAVAGDMMMNVLRDSAKIGQKIK